MDNLLQKSISEISELLDKKELTSVELTRLVLKQIKEKDKDIKAFITICEKEALEMAKKADKRISTGERLSKIDGVPISIKDNILTKGIRTTAASKMLKDFVPVYDATIVERLKNAGAVIIGKTNLDAWAHGSSTENSGFFTTHNPYDLERVPGGSSGGSCAAVAADMGFASFGTDTGGSIRQPAGFCGVVGLKPTYGRCSRYGLVAMASSLDVPGPIAKTAEDAAILLEIVCGHDSKDSTTVSNRKFSVKGIKSVTSIKGLKIGIPKEYFAKGLDPKVEEKVRNAVKILEAQGAKIKQISLPHTDYAVAVYYVIQPAEVSSNLARYDGIRYGYSVANVKAQMSNVKNLEELYLRNRGEGFGEEAKRRIMLGTYVLSAGYAEEYYKKAMRVRTLVIQDFKKAFKEIDVIITPTSPTLPFKIGERESDPLSMYLSDIYTVSANIAGIPGVSIPLGFVNSKSEIRNPKHIRNSNNQNSKKILNLKSEILNLPVGMQILGPQWSEELILRVANQYKKLINN